VSLAGDVAIFSNLLVAFSFVLMFPDFYSFPGPFVVLPLPSSFWSLEGDVGFPPKAFTVNQSCSLWVQDDRLPVLPIADNPS